MVEDFCRPNRLLGRSNVNFGEMASAEERPSLKSVFTFNAPRTLFVVPDYEQIQEKRKLALMRGAQVGFIGGQLNVLVDKGQTFAELIRHKKGIFTVFLVKGTLTGALIGATYSYTASEVAKARGNVDDGWNHVAAGMAGYLPFAFGYSKPLWQTVHGALICGALGGIVKLAMQTDLGTARYAYPSRITRVPYFPEIFLEKESVKAHKKLTYPPAE